MLIPKKIYYIYIFPHGNGFDTPSVRRGTPLPQLPSDAKRAFAGAKKDSSYSREGEGDF